MQINNRKEQYKYIQIKQSLKKKIEALAFNNELEQREIACALLTAILADQVKVEEICKRLKGEK